MIRQDVSAFEWRENRKRDWRRVWKLNKLDNSTREAKDWLFEVFMGDREYEFEPEPWDYTKHYAPSDYYRAFHFSPFQSVELWKNYIEREGPCYYYGKKLSDINRLARDRIVEGSERLSRGLFSPSKDMVHNFGWNRQVALTASRWLYGDVFDPCYTEHGMGISYPLQAEVFVADYCTALVCWGPLLMTPEDSTILEFIDFFVSAIPQVNPVVFCNGRSRVLYRQQDAIFDFVREATGRSRDRMDKKYRDGLVKKADMDSYMLREGVMRQIVDRMRALDIDYLNEFIARHEGQGETGVYSAEGYTGYWRQIGDAPEEMDVPPDYLKF